MLLSRTSQYAILGVYRLANLPEGGFVPVEELIGNTNAPRHAIAKVFHTLAKHSILESVRGARGGFRLAPGTLDMKLIQIVRAIDGDHHFGEEMDRGLCSPDEPNPLAVLLQPLGDQLEKALENTTVRQLVERTGAADATRDTAESP